MAIYERITEGGDPGSPYESLSVHTLTAALGQRAEGKLTDQQVIDAFNLTADDQTEMAAIVSHYSGLNTSAKVGYLWELERVFILCEAGLYTKAKALSDLGIS